MPLDITLITTVLRVLNNAADRPDFTEELVGLDVEMINRRPVPTHQIREALRYAQQKGWAKEGADDFGQPIWQITDAGKLKVTQG